jgi:ribose 5-phosphate isomerase B
VGSDHAGFALKEYLKPRLKDAGVEIVDCGCDSADRVDHLEYTLRVVWELVSGNCELGVVVCGNGYGMAMVANRIPGIRAAICHDGFTARTSKEAGDSNILSLGARVVGPELAGDLVQIWLKAEFKGKTVHRCARRLEELAKVERLIAPASWQYALAEYVSNRAEPQR